MNFEFKCPQCGNAVAVDESYRGQVVECPHCAKGIVVPRNKTSGQALQRPESKVVSIQCPHCGTEYEATQQDMHRLVSCEVCGKNFVAGTTSRKQSVGVTQPRPTTQTGSQMSTASRPSQMPRSRPFIAIGNATLAPCTRRPKLAIWIAASTACIIVMLSLAFTFGRHGSNTSSAAKTVAIVSTSNEANVKSSEEAPSENDADIVKKEEFAPVQASNKKSGDEPEEVATTNNENEALVRPSAEENTDRASGTGGSAALFGGSKLKGKNPLELFRFGDAPRDKLSEKNMVEYDISGFLGIQKMILRYTTKGHLCSICLVSENDHCSASESDARVSKLMQLCDEWYEGIKWNVDVQEHDGRKFAIGRINSRSYVTSGSYQAKEGEHIEKRWIHSHRYGAGPNEGSWQTTVYNYRDMVFSIVPTRGERNVVGLQVNLMDNRLKRLDDKEIDVRHLFKVTDGQYQAAKGWLQDQLKAHGLSENCFIRSYNKTLGLYDYFLGLHWSGGTLWVGAGQYITPEITISLDNGVLRTRCRINAKSLKVPLADDYAEEIITARIMIANKELEGIAGAFYDSRGNRGGSIELPCPICKGDESKQVEKCKCYNRGQKRNGGRISINKHDFEEEIESYKSEYKTGRWNPPKQPPKNPKQSPKKKKSSEYKPLNAPYKPTKAEQRDIDDADRESARLLKEQKRYYEKQRRNSKRR